MRYNGLELDRFQAEAIGHIKRGKSVLVSAPTGTGKTLIADYLIEMIMDSGKGDVIYTAPIKALSNQKYRQYSAVFGKENVGLVTGDIVINRDAPLKIMTTEILRNMLLQGTQEIEGILDDDELDDFLETAPPSNTHLPEINDLAAVIVDEIHFVDDPDRGTVWEEMLIYLPTEVRILGLSATLSNLDDFAAWLSSIRNEEVEVVFEGERAVPLDFHFANAEVGMVSPREYARDFKKWREDNPKEKNDRGRRGRGRGRDRAKGRGRRDSGGQRSGARTNHITVFREMKSEDFPALYFIYSRKLTEQLAFELSRSDVGDRIGRLSNKKMLDVHLDRFEDEHTEVMSDAQRRLFRRGIAFHHAGLHVALKSLVERLYEAKLLNVLYCTSTFALGINMPARSVVFDSFTKFNGVEIVPLSVREFMQMAGRAGRRGIDTEGDVIVKLEYKDYPAVKALIPNFLEGRAEPVSSTFNLSFNSVVNLLDRFNEEQIENILAKSFKAYQSEKMAESLRQEVADFKPKLKEEDSTRKDKKQFAYLKRKLAEVQRPILWEQFQRKVQFLQSFGYLTASNELRSAARILQRIQFEEILVTELLLAGVFETRSADEIFGIMCGLVQNLPRTAKVAHPADEKWWAIFDEIDVVFHSDVVVGAQEVVGREFTYTPQLMALGEMWALGDSLTEILAEITNPTDLSGDLVGSFRRAKDLVGQIRNVYDNDPEKRRELTQVLRDVTRDEVEVID